MPKRVTRRTNKSTRAAAPSSTASGGRGRRSAGGPVDPNQVFARDVMRADVLTLRPDDTIRSAAEHLEDLGVSGAPVVDVTGRLLGVLTTTDIARSEHVDREGVSTRPPVREAEMAEGMLDATDDDEVYPTEDFADRVVGRLLVSDWMTPRVLQVSPDATIAEVARRMLDDGVHRVFVTERERLVGVVSTQDLVRLLAGDERA